MLMNVFFRGHVKVASYLRAGCERFAWKVDVKATLSLSLEASKLVVIEEVEVAPLQADEEMRL